MLKDCPKGTRYQINSLFLMCVDPLFTIYAITLDEVIQMRLTNRRWNVKE